MLRCTRRGRVVIAMQEQPCAVQHAELIVQCNNNCNSSMFMGRGVRLSGKRHSILTEGSWNKLYLASIFLLGPRKKKNKNNLDS